MTSNSIMLYPKKSVGEFEFGKTIKSYFQKYIFLIEKCGDEVPKWDTYTIEKLGIDIYVENGSIVSIACRKTLLFNGTELIGNNINSLVHIFGDYSEKDQLFLEEEDVPHDVYDFDSYGIQVWEKDNNIDCIFCSIGDDADR